MQLRLNGATLLQRRPYHIYHVPVELVRVWPSMLLMPRTLAASQWCTVLGLFVRLLWGGGFNGQLYMLIYSLAAHLTVYWYMHARFVSPQVYRNGL